MMTRQLTPPVPRDTTGGVAGKADTPDWAMERWIKFVGRAPARLGRALDRLAQVGPMRPLMMPLSSVWVGITTLFLIGVYVGLGSGVTRIRTSMEMTDLEFFNWWPMRVLLVLLAMNLTVVTLRRIPLTLYRLGVWTVHVGILTLLLGCVMYFSQKQEGMVRIFLNKTAGSYYDGTERALYIYSMKDDGAAEERAMVPLPRLPIYYEHIAEKKNPLNRVLPDGVLAAVEPRLRDAEVKIVGYYPSAVLRQTGWRDAKVGASGEGQAIEFELQMTGNVRSIVTLVAGSPKWRVKDSSDAPFGMEYLRQPAAERLRDLQASFEGPVGITVRIPRLNIERTYAPKQGQPIVVEGSPYTIVPQDISEMPMLSKGYEGTQDVGLTVSVARKEPSGGLFEFERMAMFRYPERSPDFVMEGGKRVRKQGGVDSDIQIVYHDSTRPQFWIVEPQGSAGELLLVSRDRGGKSTTTAFGRDLKLPMLTKDLVKLEMRIIGRPENVVAEMTPVIVPPEQRPRGQTAMDAMQDSILELEIWRGKAAWKKLYVPFAQFAETSPPPLGKLPKVVDMEGIGRIGFLLSTTRRELPVNVTLTGFKATKYSGAMNTFEDYISTLQIKNKATGEVESQVAHLNYPAINNGLCFFQSMWDGDENAPAERRFSVLGVGNRPGLWVMIVGSVMIFVGIGYAFYIKPILLRKKKQWLSAWARGEVAA